MDPNLHISVSGICAIRIQGADMLDIRLIRERPGTVRKDLRKRGDKDRLSLLETLIRNDGEWRSGLQRLEGLKRKRNLLTEEIAGLKKGGKSKEAEKRIKQLRALPSDIKALEARVQELQSLNRDALMRIPNILHESVPKGRDENDNAPLRRWGRIPRFGFKPRNHLEIAEGLGLIDSERAAKIAGSGFFYLKGDLARLDYAIMQFTVDFLAKRGFTPVEPPFMMARKPYEGVTDLGDFESVMYKVEGEDLYLIATSEHPLAAMFMGETLDVRDLPIRLCGVSPCFRREVGSHGKYTKGLFRMHQFNKVEQFVFCHPRDSWRIHEELQENAEALYKALELPFRVVNVCTGDIGSLAAKKYDAEVWMADGQYREIGSNSNCTDYQARRLNIKFRESEGQAPAGFVHTLNNTALATSRTMVALLEVHQQGDGSVLIPRALRPYMGNQRKISRK
jgi:seryl-tRNA synthetase